MAGGILPSSLSRGDHMLPRTAQPTGRVHTMKRRSSTMRPHVPLPTAVLIAGGVAGFKIAAGSCVAC